MIHALVLIAGLAGVTAAPAVPATAVRAPIIDMRGDAVPTLTMPQHFSPEIRSLATSPLSQLPPPCPPAYQMPLYGLLTLPVMQYGLCNPDDWRPQWYNLTGP